MKSKPTSSEVDSEHKTGLLENGSGKVAAPGAKVRRWWGGRLFEQNSKPFDGNALAVIGLRRSQRAWRLWSVLLVGLISGLLVTAQETTPASSTNDVTEAEDISQPDDAAQTDNAAPATVMSQAGGSVQKSTNSQPSRRSRRSRRQRQSQTNGSYAVSAPVASAVTAGTNNAPLKLDYASFKIVADRNIFDPNRVPHRPGMARQRTAPVESFRLAGIMSYEKGIFAFFDGTSSDYTKALKTADAIAGYKIASITPNTVKLSSGTNEVELGVGWQMRREEEGDWHPVSRAETYAANPGPTPATTTTSAAASSGAESDIIKRMMQRREQE